MVFNHDPRLEAPWTLGPGRLRGRLDGVRPYGATAIYDALMMALPMFAARAHDPRRRSCSSPTGPIPPAT